MFIVYKVMQQSPEIELSGCAGGNAADVSIQKHLHIRYPKFPGKTSNITLSN